MSKFFTLADIALMTGITRRTLLKRLAEGALTGEKMDGKWRFTREQAGAFLNRADVRRRSAANRRALADDFLNARIKPAPACLCVLDLPGADAEFLERVLSACAGVEMRYGYDERTGMTRVTLMGDPARIYAALGALL